MSSVVTKNHWSVSKNSGINKDVAIDMWSHTTREKHKTLQSSRLSSENNRKQNKLHREWCSVFSCFQSEFLLSNTRMFLCQRITKISRLKISFETGGREFRSLLSIWWKCWHVSAAFQRNDLSPWWMDSISQHTVLSYSFRMKLTSLASAMNLPELTGQTNRRFSVFLCKI